MPSWKKIIVSGSNAELNHITSSGGININGTLNSISDGLTFGDGDTGFYQAADDDLILKRGGNTVFRANTSSQLDIEVSTLFYNTTGGFNIKTAAGVVGAPNYTFRGDTNTGMYRSAADTIGFTAGGVLQLEVTTNKISGSSTSTGSFGKLLGDGSSLTGIDTDLSGDTTPQLGGNLDLNSNNITGTGNIDILGTITAQNFIVSSSVTSIEYQSISGSTIFGDTADDTHTFLGDTISGSSTSTGSFGFVTGNKLGIGTTSPDHFAHLVMDGNDRLLIQNISAGSDSTIELKANAKSSFIFNNPSTGHLFIRTDVGTEDVILQNNDSGNVGIGNLTEASEKLHVVGNVFATGNISGSATSTGSFGKLLGDGSSLTGISATADVVDDTSPQLGGNLDLNSNNITGTGNIDILGTITAQNFIVSSSVTSIEYQSISGSTIFGDTEDDTHEFIGHVMMQSASFGMANHADRTNSNAANSYLFISQSVASKNGYVWQKAGNPGTNTFPFLLIDSANNQIASIRQDGRFSTPIVYLSNDNSGKLGEIDGDAGDSSAMYINANSRALQLSSEGKKTFKINTDGTTEIGGSGAYGVTNFGDLTVGGNLNLTSSAATLEVAGNISGSATSTGSFGRVEATKLVGDGSGITGLTSAAISSYTNNGNNRIITSVNSSTVNGEANLTFDGSTLDVTGDLTLSGDLTVNGTTTTIATTNLQIQDAFGFFATGSAGTNVDAGIIVQSGSFIDSGSALYHDISSERWSVGKGVASTATNVPDSKWGGFVATVYTASASPVGSSPKYGVGEIHVDDDGEIYIYS